MLGLGSVGLALGALSTVTSLIEAAAASANKPAGANAPAFHAIQSSSEHVTIQPVANSTLPAKAAPPDPGVSAPKFDDRTMAALVAMQEQHRGH
jgi:hypothetical protein